MKLFNERHTMKAVKKLIFMSVPAAFTIEASVILPIVFVITVWFITTSYNIHDRITVLSGEIFHTIKNASKADGAEHDGETEGLINMAGLNGRTVLLKYRLLTEGVSALTGGLDHED